MTCRRRDLEAFAADDRHRFLAQIVGRKEPMLPRITLIQDRSPYTDAVSWR